MPYCISLPAVCICTGIPDVCRCCMGLGIRYRNTGRPFFLRPFHIRQLFYSRKEGNQ